MNNSVKANNCTFVRVKLSHVAIFFLGGERMRQNPLWVVEEYLIPLMLLQFTLQTDVFGE